MRVTAKKKEEDGGGWAESAVDSAEGRLKVSELGALDLRFFGQGVPAPP